jgi:hypothetical protein
MAIVPKNQPYINEVKPTEIYPHDNAGHIIANGILNLSQQALGFAIKSDEIKVENLKNDYALEYSNLTKQYQMDYQKNPQNANLTKTYETNVRNLNEKYEKEVPQASKDYFNKTITYANQKTNGDLDFFRKETDLKFQSNKFLDGINDDITNIQNEGYNGMPPTSIVILNTKLQQAKRIYGNYQGGQIIREAKQKASRAYIGGLVNSAPEEAVKMLTSEKDGKDFNFNEHISEGEKKAYIEVANKQIKEREQWRQKQVLAAELVSRYEGYGEILKGEMSFDGMINFVAMNDLDKAEARAYLELAGYSKETATYIYDIAERQKDVLEEQGLLVRKGKKKKKPTKKQLQDDKILKELNEKFPGIKNAVEMEMSYEEIVELSKNYKMDKDELKSLLKISGYDTDEQRLLGKEEPSKGILTTLKNLLFGESLDERQANYKEQQTQIINAINKGVVTKEQGEYLQQLIINKTKIYNDSKTKSEFLNKRIDANLDLNSDALNYYMGTENDSKEQFENYYNYAKEIEKIAKDASIKTGVPFVDIYSSLAMFDKTTREQIKAKAFENIINKKVQIYNLDTTLPFEEKLKQIKVKKRQKQYSDAFELVNNSNWR